MEEKFVAYFSRIQPLSPEEKEAIIKDLDIRKVEKGTVFLKEGQTPLYNYFVLEGCVRKYYLRDGYEQSSQFFTEDEWILPAIGSMDPIISNYHLACVEDSWLIFGNDKEGNELLKTFPKFQELAMQILEKEVLKQQEKLLKYQNSNPEERYLDLLKDRPQLINRIPQYQLSSYLGVKPESLSRIRKRIADKEKS
ncbi:MAG: Crp/Fnr family transcriptional regulator [Bacteroidota bacterium]